MRTTQRKGDIATTQAIATFTKHGFDVAVPITESAPYDLVVDFGGKLMKVQCKYLGAANGSVGLRRIHSNSQGYVVKRYDEQAFDFMYVYRKSDGCEFLIENSKITQKSALVPKQECSFETVISQLE